MILVGLLGLGVVVLMAVKGIDWIGAVWNRMEPRELHGVRLALGTAGVVLGTVGVLLLTAWLFLSVPGIGNPYGEVRDIGATLWQAGLGLMVLGGLSVLLSFLGSTPSRGDRS